MKKLKYIFFVILILLFDSKLFSQNNEVIKSFDSLMIINYSYFQNDSALIKLNENEIEYFKIKYKYIMNVFNLLININRTEQNLIYGSDSSIFYFDYDDKNIKIVSYDSVSFSSPTIEFSDYPVDFIYKIENQSSDYHTLLIKKPNYYLMTISKDFKIIDFINLENLNLTLWYLRNNKIRGYRYNYSFKYITEKIINRKCILKDFNENGSDIKYKVIEDNNWIISETGKLKKIKNGAQHAIK